jgi:hypothetical protein
VDAAAVSAGDGAARGEQLFAERLMTANGLILAFRCASSYPTSMCQLAPLPTKWRINMKRALLIVTFFFLAGFVFAGGTPTLGTASGTVSKAGADSLTIRPRGADGKFEKALTLKLTGTSKITILSQQKRAGKLVHVQKDFDAKDLESNQQIAVIYAAGTKMPVLLSAVVLAPK